jgi:hypothetical protein
MRSGPLQRSFWRKSHMKASAPAANCI